jgi:hypothetical protein
VRRRARAASPLRIAALTVVLWFPSASAFGQDSPRLYAGGLFGVSALSADGRAMTSATEAALSMYKPENGWALNFFVGAHLAEYFSIQANWMWNRNDVTLVSSFAAPAGGAFYEQRRHSHQHAAVIDGLIYFRRLNSAVRPYLGTGLSLTHFSSSEIVESLAAGLSPPLGQISSTHAALRSHVGIDVRLSRHLAFRYSFSETIGGNPISPSLTPPGERHLANFQNLFGFLTRF